MTANKSDALTTAEYWNGYYANKDSHEWLKSYSALQPFFDKHLFSTWSEDSCLLHLGSGDSTIPLELARHGYNNQLCVDFSSVIVNQMSTAEAQNLGIKWMQTDVRNMTEIETQSVDVAFDKSTLDAMIYGSPWNPPDYVVEGTRRYMNEVLRVLKKDGVFLCISFRQPHFIKPLVNADAQWRLIIEVLSDGESSFDYYAFILRKASPSEPPDSS